MTISGAMQTAITGLNGQSTAISYISDNVANANTNGYKKVESRFQTIVTQSSAQANTHRSEEHTSELQSLIRISYAVFCLKKKKNKINKHTQQAQHTNTEHSNHQT